MTEDNRMPNFWWCATHHLYRGGDKRPCADAMRLVPAPPASGTPVRDEVVGAWYLLDADERQEVDDVAPDLVRVLERLTREREVEAFEREVGPGTAAPC